MSAAMLSTWPALKRSSPRWISTSPRLAAWATSKARPSEEHDAHAGHEEGLAGVATALGDGHQRDPLDWRWI